jgi:DNA processing protein
MKKIKLGVKFSHIFHGLWEVSKPEVQEIYQRAYGTDILAAAEKVFERCQRLNINVISYYDESYPNLLKEIYNPPLIIYCMQSLCNLPCISIVGTRNSDASSTQTAYKLGEELSAADICVVSGMAIGIDRASHLGALNSKGCTIGVLANGMDVIYPQKNKDLFDMMKSKENCTLISEYPPGIIAGKWTFVKRNRIISGLSHAVIIVQAGERSGSLITAGYAIEQNRDVYVTGGYSFDSGYIGSIKLINEGAKLLYETQDVFESIPNFKAACKPVIKENVCKEDVYLDENVCIDESKISNPKKLNNQIELSGYKELNGESIPKEQKELNEDENLVLNTIDVSGSNIDFLIRKTNLKPDVFAETVISLELYGYIGRKGNYIYLKN